MSSLPAASPAIRAQLLEEAQTQGLEVLHRRLQHVDPTAAARIHPNDPQRLLRALEVYEATGKTLTAHCATQEAFTHSYDWINVGLWPEDRTVLRQALAQRFDAMLEAGFLKEVEGLYQRGDLHKDLPAMRAVGYRQAWEYFSGECGQEEMRTRAIIATQQLAKRQLTWLRSWPKLHKLIINEKDNVIQGLHFLEKLYSNW